MFSYKIDDQPWSEFTSNTTVLYPNLNEGHHVLQARTIDRNWNRNSEPQQFPFTVLSPWYKETSFIIMISTAGVLILLLGGFHIYHYFNLGWLVSERTKHIEIAHLQLQHEMNEKNQLQKEILEIGEREQRRIGLELHDSLSQQLTGLSYFCKIVGSRLETTNQTEANEIKRIANLLNDSINQARGMARGLYPVGLETIGLINSIKDYANTVHRMYEVSCQVDSDPNMDLTDVTLCTHLIRIIQEAVTNAIKHGNASSINIILAKHKRNAQIVIQDNGSGFDINQQPEIGMGLKIMKFRANMIQAEITIDSTPQIGSKVICSFVLDDQV
jgi:signal transduction histidine kinase